MNNQQSQTFDPAHVLRILRQYPMHWMGPAVVVALAAVVFAVVRPATWEASQALVVRDEATKSGSEPGQFNHVDQMKAVQETILEVAKSHGVLEAALVEVGPPADYDEPVAVWPTAKDVEDLREVVEFTPPKGAEFGTTEVFYLHVKDHDRDRALALTEAVCDQLESRSQEIRDARAKSMIDELTKAVTLAQTDLDASTATLSAIEKEVGSDLAELRILNDGTTGDSALRRINGEIRAELREARETQQSNRELLALLEHAQDDPGRLIATPNRLLESQPALQRLKDGLVDAQLQTAQLGGRMSDEHPLVLAAREAEKGIGRHLHDEVAIAIRGLKVELRLNAEHVTMLEERLADTTGRLERLAQLRATYANQVAQTGHRGGLLQQAEQHLSQARASQASAAATSLISRIDGPDAGTKPVGPGRAMICLMGIAGGLAAGFGSLMLTLPPQTPTATTELVPRDVLAASVLAQPIASRRKLPAFGGVHGTALQPMVSMSLSQALRKVGTGASAWN